MRDLTDFLLARIAEDEAGTVIDGAHESWCMDRSERLTPDGKCFYCGHLPDPTMVETVPPSARVLAECEAKRRVVNALDILAGREKSYMQRLHHTDNEDATYVIARGALKALAQPYADHPDFREEWRA